MRLNRRASSKREESPRAPNRFGDLGSALLLVPAGFLVMVILGSIAVDSGAAYLGQRQLSNALTAAANDAATAALENGSFYSKGALTLDPLEADSVVCEAVAAQTNGDLRHIRLEVAVSGPQVAVRAQALVPAVFGRLVPGLHYYPVAATVRARASEAPLGPAAQTATSFSPDPCVS